MREAPSFEARVCGTRECGRRVKATARQGVWLRIDEGGEPAGWVATEHPEFGNLLEYVHTEKIGL